jgi:hypothetical protein
MSIVKAPAKTGNLKTNKNTVTTTAHENKLIWTILTLEPRRLKQVAIKLIPPKIEDTPAKCKLKIAKSTDTEGWN